MTVRELITKLTNLCRAAAEEGDNEVSDLQVYWGGFIDKPVEEVALMYDDPRFVELL